MIPTHARPVDDAENTLAGSAMSPVEAGPVDDEPDHARPVHDPPAHHSRPAVKSDPYPLTRAPVDNLAFHDVGNIMREHP